jgi:erythromycin esterase-like protein
MNSGGTMNMNLKKSKGLYLTLCVCLVIAISLFIIHSKNNKSNDDNTKVVNAEHNESKVINFLKDNYSSIDASDNNDFSTFKLLDSSLKDKEVFFTAENHGAAVNSELELKFIKYLKEKVGIKYCLLELSYSDGEMLNKYLATGDESILEEMYKPLKGTFAWNKQSYSIWGKLYEFNKSLPEGEKIKIIGIDIEHQYANAIRYMNSLIPDKNPPEEIKDIVSKVSEMYTNINTNQSSDIYGEFSIKLSESIKSNSKVYKEYFGEKLFAFELVNENIIAQVKAYKDDISFDEIRDAQMYDNFKKIYTRIPKGKFYGQWGLNHAFQKAQNNVNWLASLMNNSDSPVKGKVLSIAYLYDNCDIMTRGKYGTTKLTSYRSTEKILEPFTKEDITLFKLTGNKSPFQQEVIWPFDVKNAGIIPREGVTTDYFQYMILIKNSKATTPLNE